MSRPVTRPRTYGPKLPYRPHSNKYFETLGIRFSERTLRRHWPAIMRGIVNRDLRAMGSTARVLA